MLNEGVKLILAPMAGFSDQPFRRMARYFGADEVVTELVSANALVRGNRKTFELAALHDGERPASIQIFGADPATMAEAARRVEELRPLFIDVNMGCPARKVTKNGAGAALLEDPPLAEAIVKAVAGAVSVPVSVKIRTGKNAASKTGLEVARRAAGVGARRVTVHARSVADAFSGPVDYDAVARLKKELAVEIIGNGGITSAEDARVWLERTGADGLMIGRGALGRPSVFAAIRAGAPVSGAVEEVATVLRHIGLMEEYYGPRRSVGPIRGHMMYYSLGMEDAKRFRKEVAAATAAAEIKSLVERHFVKSSQCAA